MTQLFFGTYTKRASQGIYAANIQDTSPRIEELRLALSINQPTYLAKGPNNTLLSICQEEDLGGIALCTKQDAWQITSKALLKSPPPCFVGYDPKQKIIYTTNYHTGVIARYQIKDHTLQLQDTLVIEGSSTHPVQTQSRPHFMIPVPNCPYYLVCDLGSDQLHLLSAANDRLQHITSFSAPKGSGPRHAVWHPTQPILYVLSELSNDLLIYLWNESHHTLSLTETITLFDPPQIAPESNGAAIKMTKDGKHLYLSIRGANKLIHLTLDESGTVTTQTHYDSAGNIPRDFALSPQEDLLFVAHQESDQLIIFDRNQTTGELSIKEESYYVPEAVCVLPIN